MSEKISIDEVLHVAGLARLRLTLKEAELFAGQLSVVISHMADIESLDLSLDDEERYSYVDEGSLREDYAKDSMSRESILRGAPLVEEYMFRVPPILGEAG